MSHFNKESVIYSVGELKELVLEAKAGNKSSFEKLYNAFFTPLYRYVFSRTNDKEKTEDIVQVTFVRWYNSLESYSFQVSPLQYLFVIAKRLIIDDGRKKETLSLDENLAEELVDETTESFEERLDVKITSDVVLQELKHLGETQQEVLRLYFFAELSLREIAQILEKEEAAVRQIKHRAIKTLQQKLIHLHENH